MLSYCFRPLRSPPGGSRSAGARRRGTGWRPGSWCSPWSGSRRRGSAGRGSGPRSRGSHPSPSPAARCRWSHLENDFFKIKTLLDFQLIAKITLSSPRWPKTLQRSCKRSQSHLQNFFFWKYKKQTWKKTASFTCAHEGLHVSGTFLSSTRKL